MSQLKLKHGGAQALDYATLRVGRILKVTAEGRALVTFPGSGGGEVVARSALGEPPRAGEASDSLVGATVLLAFENGDPSLPIIAGVVREGLRPEAVRPEVHLDMGENRDVLVDGQRLVFEAQQEILVRCGKSSILLRRDGKIVIRGANVVSRSSGPNKIKGSTISLN